MKFFFTNALIIFLSIFSSFAQLNQGTLFVLQEGSSSQKGTIGYLDYATNAYTHLDSVASYGNQIVAHNGLLYVIDGLGDIRIYDIAANYSLLSVLNNVGARGIAFWGNKMLVTSIEIPFFRVYEKEAPFSYLYGLDSNAVRSEREEVIVVGQQAYLSGFYGDSVVYGIDLVTNASTLIPTPPNPYQIEEINGKIYVAAFSYNQDFTTNTAISRINPATNTIDASLLLPYCDGFTSSNSHIYQKKSNGKVVKIDAALQVVDTTNVQGFFYGFKYDKLTNTLFYSETDYVSTGAVGYIQNTTLYPPITTSLSPRDFYFMSDTGVALENESSTSIFSIYPNPATQYIYIATPSLQDEGALLIYNALGQEVYNEKLVFSQTDPKIYIGDLPNGVYYLQVLGKEKEEYAKFFKE